VRVHLDWESTYHYSEAVRLLHTELRVLPVDGFGQRLEDSTLSLTPAATPHPLRDMFGNTYHHVDFLEEIERITVSLNAEVETTPAELGIGSAADPVSPLLEHLYLAPTERAPLDKAVAAFNDAIPADLDPIETGAALCDLIGTRFEFEVGSTDVAATALDLLRVERGVCQDFSHLMLAALRQRGIPARYVSGYLAPPEGEASAEASHAWVQLRAGDRWYGFDPANDAAQDGHYIVTAVGRDYDDVPPIRGTFAGVATENWHTTLRVRSSAAEQ